MKYLPDTNVWTGMRRRPNLGPALVQLHAKRGIQFAMVPPVLIELFKGMTAHGQETFTNDQRLFGYVRDMRCEVLELPLPFVMKALRSGIYRRSGLVPAHYEGLLSLAVDAKDFDDFIKRSEAPGSVWHDIRRAHEIHEGQLDKELSALRKLVGIRHNELVRRLASMLSQPGFRPPTLPLVDTRCNAALEYLEHSLGQIEKSGAKPEKNDRGMYVDFQLLLYLADPEIAFLTAEIFSEEITDSDQKDRIIPLEDFLNKYGIVLR